MSNDPSNLRADAQRNYLRLIHAATKAFATRGPAATLENIASRAGVGIGTMYRHFPNRRALLEAVYANKLATLFDGATVLLRSEAPEKSLLSWLQSVIEYSAKDAAFSDLLNLMITDNNAALAETGGKLLKEAQKACKVRDDVTIFEILRLSMGTITDATDEGLNRANKLLLIIMAGVATTAST